ncbi:MAG: xylan 1,4-beta-xylosidase [Gammaproteobacteria bacterium]|jgi:hypothetical protein|nr:xylan 1,4-beta-xylosidase [Gammaproteobacteria bacterium]
MQRVRIADNTLFLASKGTEPRDSSPISFIAGETAYEVEADLEIDEHARGGLLLFYSRRLYCGLGFDNENFVLQRSLRGPLKHSCDTVAAALSGPGQCLECTLLRARSSAG